MDFKLQRGQAVISRFTHFLAGDLRAQLGEKIELFGQFDFKLAAQQERERSRLLAGAAATEVNQFFWKRRRCSIPTAGS
jgi:hypothetical protein